MRTFLNLLVAAAGLLAATSVRASPTPIDGPHTLDVFVPTIITPDAETVWEVGHAYDVTWDTSNAPTQITNGLGRVVLQRGCATQGESCVTVGTLASGFNITDGTVEIEVPMTLPNEDYFIVLFGDSGNRSDRFKVTI